MSTVYFLYGGVSQDLSGPTNLWQDSIGTIPFVGVPGASDDLIILGSTMPASNSLITALNSWDSSGAAVGSAITTSGVTSGITVSAGVVIGVPGDVTSSHYWYGPISGGPVTLQGGSYYAANNGDTPGAVVLRDNSSLSLGNNVTLTCGSLDVGGNVNGGVSINGGSILSVIGSCLLSNQALGGGGGFGVATLTLGAGATMTSPFKFSGSNDLLVNGTGTLAISGGVIANACNVTIGGSVAVTLSGGPTFTAISGTLTFNTSGTLTVNNSITISNITITALGNVILNNTVTWRNDVTSSGAWTFNDDSTGRSGTVNCTTISLNSPKAVNGIIINNSGALTGTQTVSSSILNNPGCSGRTQ